MDAIQHTRKGVWSEAQIEFLLSNAGYFSVPDIAASICKGTMGTRNKLLALKMSTKHTELPANLSDLQCIPDGMTVQKTSKGRIFRVPSSTPGIVSRTVHSAWANEKDDDE